MPIYESISDTAEPGTAGNMNMDMDMTPETRDTRPSWFSFRTKAGLFMLGGAALVLFAGGMKSGNQQAQVPSASLSSSSLPMMGSSKPSARACTFDECNGSNCNHEVAPYTCLFHNGGPHGGCSAIPWTDASCDDQCDLTDCDDIPIPEDAPSCDEDCEEDWCGNGRLCGSDVPYQCTDGSSRFGCSADEYKWTFKSAATTCSSCCNINTC
jgi:hypothetical protein